MNTAAWIFIAAAGLFALVVTVGAVRRGARRARQINRELQPMTKEAWAEQREREAKRAARAAAHRKVMVDGEK